MKQRNREVQLDLFGEDEPRHRLRVVFGNDMVALADRLGEELFPSGSSPFEQRMIIVPDMAMKEFLFRCFVAHPRLQMAAGMKVYALNQAVMEISGQHKRIPSFLELSLAIEEKLHGFLGSRKKQIEPLVNYLNTDSEEKKRKRISSLSEELAKLFVRYGLYGTTFLPQWLRAKKQGWQQLLWKELFSDAAPWTFPLEMDKPKQFDGKISLFGFSYLAPVHLDFFSSLNASLYQLSPCALFWEDMVSDRERLKLGNLLKRRGSKENFRDEIDQYMQQSHPLLGNWGKLGREMLKALDGFEFDEEEVYQEPQGSSMLACLKRSLLNLEESEVSVDDSIQVHSATSRLREVEILRDFLETYIQSGTQVPLSEILVVSPDIAKYAPYIQIVFGQSPFAFSIHEIPISSTSPTVQGFLQLLELKEERFAFSLVVKLFQCNAFLEKNGWTQGEVDVLCKWMKHAEIREKLFSHANSWEAGIDRLLYGLAFIPGEQPDPDSWPIPCISLSEIDLFNRFLELFESLKADLAALDFERSAAEWMEFFLSLSSKYFHLDGEKESFFHQVKQLSVSCREQKRRVWNFESIERILQHLAQHPAGEIVSSSKLQKITFTSLCHGNLRAARILWCLGMDEGVFPRTDARRSLCEMTRLKSSDYYPSKTDEDRALFLDLLVKAQDALIFSYQRLNSEDEKQQGPSILIDELVQYVEGIAKLPASRKSMILAALARTRMAGSAGGGEDILEKVGEPPPVQEMAKARFYAAGSFAIPSVGIVSRDHPAFAFDQTYFAPDAKIKKWGKSGFLAAKAFYNACGKPQPLLKHRSACEELGEISIDVRQLKKLARHPLQFYFNETLKIYLKEEEDEEEKEFLISYLRKSVLRKKALKTSPQQMARQLQAAGKLPQGLFQAAAWQQIEEEVEDLTRHLKEFGVRPEEIQTVQLPQLSVLVGAKKIHIVGKLEDVTSQGLLFHGENDLKSLVKAWPLYLIYLCLGNKNEKLLLTKKGEVLELPIEDPHAALSLYLEYYLLAKDNPSPLMPDWATALLKKSEAELFKAMSNEFSRDDAYLSYLHRRQGMLDEKEIFQLWSQMLRKVFGSLLRTYDDI